MPLRSEEFCGSPKEVGIQRGRAFRDLLLWSLNTFCRYPEDMESRIEAKLETMKAAVEKSFPDLAEEMMGTAEGARMSYHDILLLNFQEELGNGWPDWDGGCSQVAITKTEAGPLMAKTEDAGFGRIYVTNTIRPMRGNDIVHTTAVNWIVGSAGGMNDKGLCVGQSSVGIKDAPGGGIMRLTLLRAVLQYCSSVKEAIEFFRSYNAAYAGMNFLIIDATGDAAVIEKSPTRTGVRRIDGESIYAANRFWLPHMREVATGGLEESSITREKCFNECTKRYIEGPRTLEAFKEIVRSHSPHGGMCQHGPAGGFPEQSMVTTYAILCIPENREMLVTDGPPCQSEFFSYKLRK